MHLSGSHKTSSNPSIISRSKKSLPSDFSFQGFKINRIVKKQSQGKSPSKRKEYLPHIQSTPQLPSFSQVSYVQPHLDSETMMPGSHKYTSSQKHRNSKGSNTLYYKQKLSQPVKSKKTTIVLNQPPKIAKKSFLTFAESSSSHIDELLSNYEITGMNAVNQFIIHKSEKKPQRAQRASQQTQALNSFGGLYSQAQNFIKQNKEIKRKHNLSTESNSQERSIKLAQFSYPNLVLSSPEPGKAPHKPVVLKKRHDQSKFNIFEQRQNSLENSRNRTSKINRLSPPSLIIHQNSNIGPKLKQNFFTKKTHSKHNSLSNQNLNFKKHSKARSDLNADLPLQNSIVQFYSKKDENASQSNNAAEGRAFYSDIRVQTQGNQKSNQPVKRYQHVGSNPDLAQESKNQQGKEKRSASRQLRSVQQHTSHTSLQYAHKMKNIANKMKAELITQEYDTIKGMKRNKFERISICMGALKNFTSVLQQFGAKKQKYQTLFLRIHQFLVDFKANLENSVSGIEKENNEVAIQRIKKENELQGSLISKTQELEEIKNMLVRETENFKLKQTDLANQIEILNQQIARVIEEKVNIEEKYRTELLATKDQLDYQTA